MRESDMPSFRIGWIKSPQIGRGWQRHLRNSSRFGNKWVAHFEVEYDPSTKQYKPVQLPSLLEVYQLIEEVIPIITESVFHLAGLFKNLDNSPDQWTEISQREASKYWKIRK